MYRKTRRKIVASVMAALFLLLVVTLSVIVLSSYFETAQQSREMLAHYMELFSLETPPGEEKNMGGPPAFGDLPDGSAQPPDEDPPGDIGLPPAETPLYTLSTFYSVAFSDTEETLMIDSGLKGVYSDDELVQIAKEILETGKTAGRISSMTYQVSQTDEYTLVAFMDNTVTDDSFHSLIRNTLIIGGIVILVCFFFANYMAYRIIKPLEENDKKQRQFISDAGHELKTPVSVISSNAELLSRQIGSNEWLDNIRYENERMGELVTQLLDLSRTETAKVQMEPVDFSRVVMGEVLPFESVAFEKGISIKSDIDEGIMVLGNRSQLSQLTAILVDNAISHAEGDGGIGISLKSHSRYSVLTVENSGQEIPKEHLDRLFERFYRVDDARSGDEPHYGLGLAIAKAVAESHDGKISVSCSGGKVIFQVMIPEKKI